MELDDELCLCFHVTKRKVIRHLQVERPQRAAQLSECQGAGTGCGWCRPFLERLFRAHQLQHDLHQVDLPQPDEYAVCRAEYRREKMERPF
jgi:NAD(P)H-nitrite reductase large subunit